MIYFDNSATTLQKPIEVANAVYNSISSQKYGNPSRGSHDFSINALRGLYKTRFEIAKLFSIDEPLNIALTSNVTTGLNLVIRSLLNNTDHVISTDSEHNSVLRPLYQFQSRGGQVSFLKIDFKGNIILDELKKSLKKNTKALIITQASNVSGIATDIERVFDFCLENNLILIIDGAQGAGTLSLKFKGREFPRTVYAFTGHKSLYGPQGTGGLIFVGDIVLKSVFSGGSGINSFSRTQPDILPDIFEYGTQNVHSNAGLFEGVKYINETGIENIERNLYKLTKYFYDSVKNIDGVILYNDFSSRMAPIVSLNFKHYSSSELSDILWNKYEIATRPGSHCAPKYHESMGTRERGMVRFSFSTFNTFEEVDEVVNILRRL